MLRKWLTLVLCVAALMPQQVCTCLHAEEAIVEVDHACDCKHEPAPMSEHDEDCRAEQPLVQAVAEKASTTDDLSVIAVFTFAPESLTLPTPSNRLDSPASPPPHVPLFMSHCALRN